MTRHFAQIRRASFVFGASVTILFAASSLAQVTPAAIHSDVIAPVFSPVVTYSSGGGAGTSPGSLAVADVNGDGKPDLIVANTPVGGGVASIGVLLGNGNGTFQPAVLNKSLSQIGEINALAVADVNGDGKPDLVVVTCCASNGDFESAVLLGNGNGTFQPPVTYDGGGLQESSVVVGDVNGDGHPDIVMVNWVDSHNQSTANVLLGNGDGTFRPFVSSDGPPDPSCAVLADVNHDGKPDLLICSEDTVAVLLGNGDGTFQPFTNTNFYTGFCDSSPMVADVNADGLPDIVVANAGANGCGTQGFAGFLQGNGDGTFQSEVNYLALSGTNGIGAGAVADLNGDGKLDAMVTSGLSLYGSVHGSVGVLVGNGDGTFGTPTAFDTGGPQAQAVVAADLNADGKPDIIVANFGSANIGVLLNATGSATSTTTTLTSSKNPGIYQQPVTFTAVVTSPSGTPTGTVVFYNGDAQFPATTLVNGVATYTTSDLARGWAAITAHYLGSDSFDPSTSAVLNERINKTGLFLTIIHLSSSDSSSYVGQSVTFTATMSAKRGEIPQDGDTVVFTDNGAGIGSGSTRNGVATCTWISQKARHHTIGASFLGDDDFSRRYTQITQLVDAYPTAVHVSANPNPAVYGQTITFTVNVTSAGPDIPTGSIQFPNVGEVPLVGGVATVTKSQLRAGTHTFVVEYLGDAASAKSKSAPFVEVINPATTTSALASSTNPSASGQQVTFTATVTSSSGLAPFGKVTFTSGSTTLGTVALKDTKASISTSALPVGSNTITATYSGSDSFTPSSASLTQVVHP